MLILVMGLPGVGKTTFARALAENIGAEHINSDRVRTALHLRGAYSESDKRLVYEEMYRRTEALIRRGKNVIVDSTFYRKDIRAPYLALADKYDEPVIVIVVKASEQALRRRLAKPRPDSEADYAVYQKIKAAYEPPDEPVLEVWSDRLGTREMVAQVLVALEEKE